jgi:hypothetical protein
VGWLLADMGMRDMLCCSSLGSAVALEASIALTDEVIESTRYRSACREISLSAADTVFTKALLELSKPVPRRNRRIRSPVPARDTRAEHTPHTLQRIQTRRSMVRG